jgi:hypothetical protein
MKFPPITSYSLMRAHTNFIYLMKKRDSLSYGDFNSYDKVNPNVVFPVNPVPWNAGYTTMVVINKTYVGYPVYKTRDLQIFIGMSINTNEFHIFYSKIRKGRVVGLRKWTTFYKHSEISLNEHRFAQKFALTLPRAKDVLDMVIHQAVRIFRTADFDSKTFAETVNTHFKNHPRYAPKKKNAPKVTPVDQEITTKKIILPDVPDGKQQYVFMAGGEKIGGGEFLNVHQARTTAVQDALGMMADGKLPLDSVIRIFLTTEVSSFKVSII